MATYSLKRSTGGHLLRTPSGHLANECGGVTCTLDGSPVPGVNMTVAFGGGGTKSLFGETWTSGETKLICPTSYLCTPYTATPTSGYVYYSSEEWEATIGYDVLTMFGFAQAYTLGMGAQGGVEQQQVFIGLSGTTTAFGRHSKDLNVVSVLNYPTPYSTTTTYTPSATTWTSYSGLVGAPPCAAHGAPIKDGSFGSVTTNGGITISWARADAEDWNTCGI